MTQLIIAGTEAVLPLSFSVTVRRENPFFTKSGEYTYDVQLRLDNAVNLQLYGFLNRLNRTEQVPTGRTAILMADGHVYCRGTEVITKWTDQTVSIQIVSGESELNFFVGQEQKIEDFDLGSISGDVGYLDSSLTYPDVDYCLAPVRTPDGTVLNSWTFSLQEDDRLKNPVAQPYLCAILRRLMSALGYTVGTNHLETTLMKNLFLVNQLHTTEYAKMLPGWTVKDFLTEVEKLCGIVFLTDNADTEHPKVDIVLKTIFYQDAHQVVIKDVVDESETEISDSEGGDQEFTASDVEYDLPESRWSKLMKLPEDLKLTATYADFASFNALATAASSYAPTDNVIMRDTSTGRCYIRMLRTYTGTGSSGGTFGGGGNEGGAAGEQSERQDYMLLEVDQYRKLERENATSTLELKITPAPMAFGGTGCEIIDLCSSDGYKGGRTDSSTDEEDEGDPKNFEDVIRDFSKEESSAIDLICAFHNGTHLGNGWPIIYTDAGHAALQRSLYPQGFNSSGPYNETEGSLRLQDLENGYYQGGYQIDTRTAVTFETFDPNTIDTRQVYVIGGRRYVVRDVEETIGSEGRQPMWRVTCHPINITDETLEHRWVLTRGVWDDGAAWLDDGRWNDNPT